MGKFWKRYGEYTIPFWGFVVGVMVWLAALVVETAVSSILGETFTQWISEHPVVVLSILGWVSLLWHHYRKMAESKQLADRIDELEDRGDSRPLLNAARVIMDHTDFGKGKTEPEVLKDILRLGAGHTFPIRGRKATLFMMKPHLGSSSHSEIPRNFLKHCTVFYGGFQVDFALIESINPEQFTEGNFMTNAYLDPRVSMAAIEHHYGEIE